jgi:HTH-type transcriptional regulator / antitoxin HipB
MDQIARTPKQLGAVLRRQRILTGLSQGELGTRVGLRQATISNIEAGNPATRISTFFDLLAALDLEVTITTRSTGPATEIEDIF